jgi:peptide/nickel transport system permease protein
MIGGSEIMRYLKFFSQRLLFMAFTMIVVSFLVFLMLRASGVNPLDVLLGEKKTSTVEVKAQLAEQYHLNKPLTRQYLIWLKGAVGGDFGADYIKKQSVVSLIGARVQVTVGLVVMGMGIAILIAIPFGIISAVFKNTWVDHLISFIMLVLTSTPGFLVAIVALVLISKFMPSYHIVGTYSNFGQFLSRLLLPSLCMSLGTLALIGRITRSSMISTMQADFMVTTKAKGMGSGNIVIKHGFHNSVIPVLTISALMVGGAVAATVLVEQVFSLPGLGTLLTDSIMKYNYPVIQALTLLMLVIFQVISLIVDFVYVFIDPRIKI